ncbi:hypothetical protein OESDEN_10153 [Oesophagostomum dentatum]|uniref:Uncharacterized protein n=1 Tax=Oesophagostomum dentatum TaxID=61180 RepID=A0A0B1SYF2_OESDE|nr:hypothetical protein OESDEN_10153 [Oesophagostomum dentatum]
MVRLDRQSRIETIHFRRMMMTTRSHIAKELDGAKTIKKKLPGFSLLNLPNL